MKTLLASLILLTAAVVYAEPVIIVNKKVAAASLSKDMVEAILKGKTKNWPEGGRIALATLKEGSVHEAVLTSYAGMTGSQFSSHWNRLVFTGKANEPKSFATEKDLVAFVASTDEAMGYADSANVSGDVKVLKVE